MREGKFLTRKNCLLKSFNILKSFHKAPSLKCIHKVNATKEYYQFIGNGFSNDFHTDNKFA